MTTDERKVIFARWVTDHAAILHHVANGFAAGADRDDLWQELLLALWRATTAFRGGAQASTFLYRVAHNAALTWKRTERNYRRRLDAFENETAIAAATNPPPHGREAETLQWLYARIRELPPLDRSLVLLQLDGLGYPEIAAIHGLTETNVGARLHRVKKTLTQQMKEITHELQ